MLLYSIKHNTIKHVKKNIVDEIYELRYRPLIKNDIIKYIKENPKDNITLELKKDKMDDYIKNQKTKLSKLDDKIPLYDAYSKNMYLISKEMIYNRVIRHHYRFPGIKLLDKLKEEEKNKLNKRKLNVLEKRTLRKIKYMLNFLSYFDLNILETS